MVNSMHLPGTLQYDDAAASLKKFTVVPWLLLPSVTLLLDTTP